MAFFGILRAFRAAALHAAVLAPPERASGEPESQGFVIFSQEKAVTLTSYKSAYISTPSALNSGGAPQAWRVAHGGVDSKGGFGVHGAITS